MSNKQIIHNRLKAAGFNEIAIAAIMGNMQSESGFNPHNVEDRSGIDDNVYTAKVDCGEYSNFCEDGYGYGIAQWTHNRRKKKLYDFAKRQMKSIGDINMQLDYFIYELKADFRQLHNKLINATNLHDATVAFMLDFEKPQDKSAAKQNERVCNAEKIYAEFNKSGNIQIGEIGCRVEALQILLNGAGYDCGKADGEFGNNTRNAVVSYQRENKLTPTGIVDANMWSKLFH